MKCCAGGEQAVPCRCRFSAFSTCWPGGGARITALQSGMADALAILPVQRAAARPRHGQRRRVAAAGRLGAGLPSRAPARPARQLITITCIANQQRNFHVCRALRSANYCNHYTENFSQARFVGCSASFFVHSCNDCSIRHKKTNTRTRRAAITADRGTGRQLQSYHPTR